MSDNEPSKDNTDDEEDWMSYANAGFGSTDYSLWDESEETSEVVAEPEWGDENLQLETGAVSYTHLTLPTIYSV